MAASIITTEDLYEFKMELLEEIKQLLQHQSGQPTKKWLKTEDVRDILGISIGTLQNLRLKGILPYTKVGRILYYDYHDIMQLLDKNRINKSF